MESPGGIGLTTSFSPSSRTCETRTMSRPRAPFVVMINRILAPRDIVRHGDSPIYVPRDIDWRARYAISALSLTSSLKWRNRRNRDTWRGEAGRGNGRRPGQKLDIRGRRRKYPGNGHSSSITPMSTTDSVCRVNETQPWGLHDGNVFGLLLGAIWSIFSDMTLAERLLRRHRSQSLSGPTTFSIPYPESLWITASW